MTTTASTDRRVLRTQQMLQDALLGLIAERGYDALRVQDIAERANIGRATFYLHYPDKEHLMIACITTVADQLGTRLEAAVDQQATALSLTEQAFVHIGTHASLFRSLLGAGGPAQVQRQLHALMADIIARSLRSAFAGHAGLDTLTPVLAAHTAGALLALVVWWLEHGAVQSAQDMAALHQQLTLPGISAAFATTTIA